MPVEFSAAAFRFGHSQTRSTYDLNAQVTQRPIFTPGGAVDSTDDLRGFTPLPANWKIDWSLFFPLGSQPPQPSRLIDTELSGALFDLPHMNDLRVHAHSLAFRNLARGQSLTLPSGQDVARAMGEEVLTGAALNTSLDPTPLWFYILGEASVLGGGRSLGPTGGRIVAEVIPGLLELDPESFLEVAPLWKPGQDRQSVGGLLAFANA